MKWRISGQLFQRVAPGRNDLHQQQPTEHQLMPILKHTGQTVYQQPPVGHEDSNSAFNMQRMQAYCDQMQGFVDSINGTRGGEGTPEDGRAGVAAVLGMLESAHTQQMVAVG